jgi:uncharacterized protein YmfQ (DUF2313 family)
MSHVSTYKTKIQHIDFFLGICEQKGYDVRRGVHTVQQFGSNQVNCVGSLLIEGWRYRIAITQEGELKYDHFGSQSNTMELLGKTIQEYNEAELELAIPYDEIQNHYKETLQNGDIRVVLEY